MRSFIANRLADLVDIAPPLVCTLLLLAALTKALVYLDEFTQ